FMDLSHSSSLSSVSQNFVSSDVVDESCVPSGSSLCALTEEIVAYEKKNDETHPVKKLDALCTPESFVTHSNFDTPGGNVYYILKYATEAGFALRRSCHKRLRNVDVKQNYLVCNRKEFKHLSKRERLLTYLEEAFIVKATSVNIGATRAHHLLTGIKGSYLLVHSTTVNFKNFFRSVNCYIGDSDAQILIHKMENRKKPVSDFSFDYLVENVKLSGNFWADEASKYNYREFGDVVSFDATFKTNKYKMVFVPFTSIDNHRKCVTVVAGLLKNETTKSYMWLLKEFIKAFGKAASIVVTDPDGAMRNAIEAEFAGSKHRLCMWHITQKLPAKVCIIKESPYVYGMPKKKKKPQSVDKVKDKAEENNTVDLFFKKDRLYKVLQNVGDGSVVCSYQLFVRVGILCKHIFCVFKNANVEMIPQQYIMRRWMKNLIPATLRNKRNRYGEKNVVVENFANEATLIVDHCVHLLSKDEPRLGAFVEKLKSLKKEVEADCLNPPSKNKTHNLEQLVGVPKPPAFDVDNPTVGSTKGRKKLRIKGGKDKTIEKSLKDRNSCSLCGGTDHNKRTCPRRFKVQDEVVVQKEVCQEEVVV
nr:protein FAR1-related sequence 5-like [Tanacetum cinerariifolium]